MKSKDLEKYIMSLKGVEKSFPFNEKIEVYKVSGKIFVLVWEDGETINLKCNPVYSKELRSKHREVTPGYHMNKKHWNSVDTSMSLTYGEIKSLIEHSYMLVASSLTKKKKEVIGFMDI